MRSVPTRQEFERLRGEYEKWYASLEESLFEKVGKSVRSKGYYDRIELWQVAFWKVGSSRNDTRILDNGMAEVERRTRDALKEGVPDAKRLKSLWKLDGVGTPIASALLTVWNPDDYAIIDWVVWDVARRWVGGGKSYDSADAYDKLLNFCRHQARTLGWTARDVEKALYSLGESL